MKGAKAGESLPRRYSRELGSVHYFLHLHHAVRRIIRAGTRTSGSNSMPTNPTERGQQEIYALVRKLLQWLMRFEAGASNKIAALV
jgi:hypothetical protein